MGLVTSIAKMLVADELEIEVAFLPPLDASAYQNRHTLARAAHAALAVHFGLREAAEQTKAAEDLAA